MAQSLQYVRVAKVFAPRPAPHLSHLQYGQTGSGKTYTILGHGGQPGIIPLAVQHVFSVIHAQVKQQRVRFADISRRCTLQYVKRYTGRFFRCA
mgnify:CR=1 FL=1